MDTATVFFRGEGAVRELAYKLALRSISLSDRTRVMGLCIETKLVLQLKTI
jgi:hypothetical protein